MDLHEELRLFRRYFNEFTDGAVRDSHASSTLITIHLAQQLDPYLNAALDRGYLVRCILDISGKNLFTNSRDTFSDYSPDKEVNRLAEYNHAILIIRLTKLFLHACKGERICKEFAKRCQLDSATKFYFGEELSELHDSLLQEVSPHLQLAQ